MNRIIISALVLSAVTANAQVKEGMVGINTDEPRATMHIEPGVSESKGLIIPRITAAQMKTMTNLAHFGADHHAIITYLKETLPATDRTGKLVDVAEPGYYYYDNTTGVQKWKTFGGGAEQDFKALPASAPGLYNYLSKGSGIGGTSLGTGYGNIGIGRDAFSSFTNSSDMTGNANIGMGEAVFQFPNYGYMSSSNNIGIGSAVYSFNDSGSMSGDGQNIGMGNNIYRLEKDYAGFNGSNNTGIGKDIFRLTNGEFRGSYNTSIGNDLFYLERGGFLGYYNMAIGNTLYHITSGNMEGSENISIGKLSYYMRNGNITNTAKKNIALGNKIYYLSNSSTSTFSGENNIGIGDTIYELPSGDLTGARNIGIGDGVFVISTGNLSGEDNIGIGTNTMSTSDLSGKHNIGIGTDVMVVSGGITGNYNIALGYHSMHTNGKIAGTDNIAIGYQALHTLNDIGSYNIGIGNMALNDHMAKGNANIQLGNYYVGTPVAGELNNVVAIGNGINNLNTYNTDNNVILLGNQSTDAPKVGVGTYKPQAKLDVNGGVRVGKEAACTSANEGTIIYDSTIKKFQGCDGTSWVNLN